MYEDLVKKFKQHNITVIPVTNAEGASKKVLELIPKGASVGYGGSVTLEEIGILDKIRQGDYQLFDREKHKGDREKYVQVVKQAAQADVFLSGSNAITRDGQIVNIDRNGNRIAPLIWGPERVIIVVGKNKIVKDYNAAIDRIKNLVAPKNAQRLELDTPCAKTGKCTDCFSPDRICCSTAIIERQHFPERMTVILVDQDLGY